MSRTLKVTAFLLVLLVAGCAGTRSGNARMLPAVSALDCLFADLGVDHARERVVEAFDELVRG